MNHIPMAATIVAITDLSEVGQARRVAVGLAENLGLPESVRGNIAIVTTEAARNLIVHGGGGEIILQPIFRSGFPGIEILALDKGPGMVDVAYCLRDGYSTSGTPGTGLGAIQRLSNDFDLYSLPGVGTVVLARFWTKPTAPTLLSSSNPALPFSLGAIRLAMPREEECGDAWAWHWDGTFLRVLLCDGLGHGPIAAEASQEAARRFLEAPYQKPSDVLEMIHGYLRQTRGAVGVVTEVNIEEGEIEYAGIGNIAGVVITDGFVRSMISQNGTLGYQAKKFSSFRYPAPTGSVIILNSDGLNTRWSLDRYPGLLQRDPSLVASVLYRDFTRGRDDVTVIVLQLRVTSSALAAL